MPNIRTVEEVREWFQQHGISIASWAKENGFKLNTVYDALATYRKRRCRCKYGESHRAAVALGLKPPPPSGDTLSEQILAKKVTK